ncbi:hypothetical protein N7478_010639 [Penicillium angulare]|uniref:uncharacterized protein n=1 Tax=Penicillium angulare TaxID=116970 RepID=UPI0025417DF7|nr:uncharacterized protein N7478_010639 [Penicillium angulare]KAJ5267831.1 hypothetical protein N7478_010639 [Penicillium angulare]
MSHHLHTIGSSPPYEEHPAAHCCRQSIQNALFFAIARGDMQAVIQLLQHGIDVNSSGPKGQPTLFTALEYQQHEILELLLGDPRIDVHITDGQGHTALHLAVIYDDHLAVQILLQSRSLDVNRPDFAGDSALLLAAKTYSGFDPRRDAILELLVSHPQSMVSQRDTKGRSLLQYATFTSNRRLIAQLARSCLD